MSSPLDMVAMQAGAREQSSRDLQNQLGNVGNLHGKNISPEARAKKLREACEGFESIFIQKMWQEMRNAVPKGGLLQGREEKFWQDMYDQELSKSMTKAGGIGLADMMYAQLSRNLGDASRSTAGMTTGAAFTPSAAPLVPLQNMESPLPDSQVAAASPKTPASDAMPNIYDGEAPAMAEPADNGQAQQPAAHAQQTAVQQQPTAVAQAAAVQPPSVAQPVAQPAHETRKVEKKHNTRKAQSGHNGDSPLDLVAIARREAGDKLGARAIRPPLKPHRSAKRQVEAEARQQLLAQQQQQPVVADNRPGTANDLQRAMAAARGEQAANQASAMPLADIVARVKASQQNAMATASQAGLQAAATPQAGLQPVPTPQDGPQPEPSAPGQPAPLNPAGNPANTAALPGQDEAPTVRKVTYSTNIPKNSRSTRKGQKGAIRMLNVDNTNHNSNAGKGIAAYHAQQQAARQTQPVAAPQAPVPPASPAPLTARDVAPAADSDSGFAIPPLTSGDLNV